METKSIFKSKTIWFNSLVGLATILAASNPETLTALLVTLSISPATATTVSALIISGVNMWLRKNTTTTVTMPTITKPNKINE